MPHPYTSVPGLTMTIRSAVHLAELYGSPNSSVYANCSSATGVRSYATLRRMQGIAAL